MLQQAIPNCSMNIEEPRTQFMNWSNFVRMNGVEPKASRSVELNRSSAPSPIRASWVDTSFTAGGVWSLLIGVCPLRGARTAHPSDRAVAPCPSESDGEHADERDHRQERFLHADRAHGVAVDDRPREDEDGLDVEDDEQQRDHVVLDIELDLLAAAGRHLAGLVGGGFALFGHARPQYARDDHHRDGNREGYDSERTDGNPWITHSGISYRATVRSTRI